MDLERLTKAIDSVLVVGGCGFLGHHIVNQLLSTSTSPQVSVLDLRTSLNRHPKATYYDGDITSKTSVRSILSKTRPQVIIHTASPTAVRKGGEAIFKKVNIDGTQNLLECAGEAGCVIAFVFTSSASVIHDSVSDLIHANEDYPILKAPDQPDYYPESKGIAEEFVTAANKKYGDMLTIALRPAGIFGEGDVQLIPPMLKAYEKGQTKFQVGGNQNLFDYTYVGNVAYAHILAAAALIWTTKRKTPPLDHEKVDGEAFFITNDEPVFFWDFPRTLWLAAGDKTEPKDVWVLPTGFAMLIATLMQYIFLIVFRGKKEPNLAPKQVYYSTMTRYYSIEKAKRRLGYAPQYDLVTGVKRSMDWFLAQKKAELEKKDL
ncbi:erg26, C-3 sterol dehydrogenase [Agyrium rufum]|nr:erg26, C-3 sterol dehydrogenase [Agyrium rufum]